MNPFLRYLADKNSAHTQTDRQTHTHTDRHMPMTTRPCGLRRAGNEILRMVTIEIVIKSILGRLTLYPAGMHCPAWDDAFVF